MPDPAVTAIVDRTGDAASVAWAHEGKGNVASLPNPLAAIAAAGLVGNATALQSVTAPKDLRKAASAALHKLKSQGIKITAPAETRSFTLAKETFDLPSRAFLSTPDAQGDIELLLTVSDATGNCALGMILGGGGVRETRHAHLGRGDLRDVWKNAEGRPDLVEIPYASGLHFADAAAAHAQNKHDWKHFLEHVPAATLQAARVLDPLARLPEAVEENEQAGWIAPPELLDQMALQAGMTATLGIIHGQVGEPEEDAGVDAKLAEVFTKVADDAFAKTDREAFARAARTVAASYALHGRPVAAARAEADAEAALSGSPGSAIQGVDRTVRLLCLTGGQEMLRRQFEAMSSDDESQD